MKVIQFKLIVIILLGSAIAFAQSPNITEMEYYFDTDPGFGNGTAVSITSDSTISSSFNLDISGLDEGIHYAFIRTKDENGVWSLVHKMIIQKVGTPPPAALPDIVSMEYFFDTDPGTGKGTDIPVVDGSITTTAFNLDISSLPAGFHKVYFRTKDENNIWSLSYLQNILKVTNDPALLSPDVVAMEYFFDADPGFGNGTSVPVSQGMTASTAFDVDISSLTAGYHKVYLRVKDANGTWSLVYLQNFVKVSEAVIQPLADIVAMEYFFDTDPGFGNGTPVPVLADTLTSTAFDLDVSGLDAGYHKVYFRTKSENDVWGLASILNIVKVVVEPVSSAPEIVAMEYFIDTDPGFGNGTDVPITADSIINEIFSIDVSALTPHDHNLYLRVMDENNHWSQIFVDTFNLAEVELTAYLEGPYSGGNMGTALNAGNNLPLSQPFNVAPWNYDGSESVAVIPNANIVDWVLVETRNAPGAPLATGGTVIFRQAAFVLNDGSIVDIDGISNLEFKVHTASNNFVVIYHRNHLSIMSAADLNATGWKYSYDFSTGSGQAYNNGQKDLGGVWGMIAGDTDGDGDIDQADINNVWKGEAGNKGYYNGDLDMNSEVNNQDKNDNWLDNVGEDSQVPD